MKKISRRNFVKLGLSCGALVSLSACSAASSTAASSVSSSSESSSQSTAQADGTFNLDNIAERDLCIMERMGSTHIIGRTQTCFADELEALSGGKITTTRYLDGELETGSVPKEMFESGIVDSARFLLEIGSYYGWARSTVFGLPFLFDDRDHFWRFADSEIGVEILDEFSNEDQGAIGLGYIEEGARHFFTKEKFPLATYHDLAGLKIRVQTSDVYVGLVEALGASATTLDWTEIYTALSTGIVDGAENPYSGYSSYMLNEVAPNIYESGHIYGANILCFSKDIWNEMNDDEKALVRQAASVACAYNQAEIEADEVSIKAEYIANGLSITEPPLEEKEELFNLVYSMYDEFAGEYMDLVEAIRAV